MAARELEVPELPQAADPPRGPAGELFERFVGPFLPVEPPGPHTPTGSTRTRPSASAARRARWPASSGTSSPPTASAGRATATTTPETLSATSWRHVKFIEQFPAAGSEARRSRWSRCSTVAGRPAATPGPLADDERRLQALRRRPVPARLPDGRDHLQRVRNVYIQPDICNGCAYCIAACPFGVITRSHFDGHAHKCTLCYDRQRDGLVPACAKACPTASIQFGPIDELRERARRRVEELSGGASAAPIFTATPRPRPIPS